MTAWPLYAKSGKELAPVEDQSAIAVMLEAAPDATLKSTSRWAGELAASLQTMPETKYLWALVTSNGRFGGMITKDFKDRDRSTAGLQPEVFGLVSKVAGVRAFPVLIPPLPGAGQYDVELIIKSDKPVEQMAELASEIVKRDCQAKPNGGHVHVR